MKDHQFRPLTLKSLKGALMLLFSLGAGGAGVYFTQEYIEGEVALLTVNTDDEALMVSVVVPNRTLIRGEVVTDADLAIRQFPEQYVDANSVKPGNYEMALGQRMDFDIGEGSPLLWAHLAGGATPTFSGKVEQGLRAMTVRVDDINSISGFLQPGDRVDLLMSYGSGTEQRILPLMEHLDVIATGLQTEADKQADAIPRSFSTITVHVTPAQAQKLTLAQQVGTLTAILRNPEDKGELSDPPLSLAQLLADSEGDAKSLPVKRPRRIAKAPAIQYIIGGQ